MAKHRSGKHDDEREPPQATVKPRQGRAPTAPPEDLDGAAPKTTRRMALDAAFRNDADLRLGLTENLSQVRVRRSTIDERVRHAFKDFKPTVDVRGEPARPNRVQPGAPASEVSGRVMRDRLEALQAATPGPGITIRAGSSLIQWDGDADEASGAKSGTIEFGKLMELLDGGGVSALTLSTSSAVAACEAERKARTALDEIDRAAKLAEDGDDGDTETVGGNGAGRTSGKTAEFVERSVNTQMWRATAPEAKLEYGLIPNGADGQEAQARLLETFQLRPPGPSDATSYHDFSVLQIAFEDVWSQIFDGELETLGRQLYREYVGLADFLGYDPDTADRPISSLDDLAWLIGEIRFLSQITQDGLPPGGDGQLGTNNEPKDGNTIAKEAEDFVKDLPGGRVGTAIGTLGLSELVLWLIRDAASWGTKEALRWDDLLTDRRLSRGDRIEASIDNNVVAPGSVELVLWTDISKKKEIAFQVWVPGAQKPENRVRVANYYAETETRVHSTTLQPAWYRHRELIPSSDLPRSLLEFASQEGETQVLQGRYVLGDLDKIVADGGRFSFYWKDS